MLRILAVFSLMLSGQALAHGMGDFSGDYLLVGPTTGYCDGFNYGVEASAVRSDGAFYGAVVDYSRCTGAGVGVEGGLAYLGTDLMWTVSGGPRIRAFATVGFATIAAGCSAWKGCEATAMIKLGWEK